VEAVVFAEGIIIAVLTEGIATLIEETGPGILIVSSSSEARSSSSYSIGI
jgi:hypothetical protein